MIVVMNTYEYLEYLFPKHNERPNQRADAKMYSEQNAGKKKSHLLVDMALEFSLFTFFVRKRGIPGIHRYSNELAQGT
jgi:hypothetical protein